MDGRINKIDEQRSISMACESTPEGELTEQREQYLSLLKYCRLVTEEDESQLFYTYCDELAECPAARPTGESDGYEAQDYLQQYPEY